VSKNRREDFTLTLVNYVAERFLYRLSHYKHRARFVLKGAMLFAVRVGGQYRPTRDLDLLGTGDATAGAVDAAVRDIVGTVVADDGLIFALDTLRVQPIREDNRHGGMRATLEAHLAGARIPMQIDVGFGDAVTPEATYLDYPTLLDGMPAPNVLAYQIETVIAEKVEAMVDHGISNSRMKDFTDIAVAARRMAFDGSILIAAVRATFRRRVGGIPEGELVALTDAFLQEATAQANWKAFARRSHVPFESLEQVVSELRAFLRAPLEGARSEVEFTKRWPPGGPWT
jgi:predicted nucleotidyltransferase component of viral defense system